MFDLFYHCVCVHVGIDMGCSALVVRSQKLSRWRQGYPTVALSHQSATEASKRATSKSLIVLEIQIVLENSIY